MWFNTTCAGCDEPGEPICRTCRFALVAAAAPTTGHRGRGGPGRGRDRPGSGTSCLRDDEVIAALAFTGRARRVVLGLKYRNRTKVAPHLAGLLVNRLLAVGVRPERHRSGSRGRAGAHGRTNTNDNAIAVDVVTWAPTSGGRRRERGFDQAELVARHVAAQLGLPCRRLLERTSDGGPQTGRGRIERLHGAAFRVRPGIDGARVLLVDDVVTTGSTLRSAAAALRSAGVAEVVPTAVAATPSGVARRRSGGPGGGRVRLVA